MELSLARTGWLQGKQVAFTGRLATMTRREAAELVQSLGGAVSSAVTRSTAILVIGQEGLPIRGDGALSRNLRKARRLNSRGAEIAIWSEQEWLKQLGAPAGEEGIHRLLSAAEIGEVLGATREQLRAWVRSGLIRPAETLHGVSYFDFGQVAVAKKLRDLTRQGVTTKRIRRTLSQLQPWLSGLSSPLSQLSILERNGQLLVRMEEGRLSDPHGQMHFEFPDEHPASYEFSPDPRTPESWYERGCEHEDAGHFADAATAYRQALLLGGPSAEICFNLANVLYALGQRAQASERFRQAVEIDPEFIEAWNNLGIVLAEMKQCDDAVWAYRKAVELDPQYADAHYNLADCLDRNGCTQDARAHWEEYARLDPGSAWGLYAQDRLAGKHARQRRKRKKRRDSV